MQTPSWHDLLFWACDARVAVCCTANCLQEEAIMSENGPSDERLEAIYDRLDELDPNTFESRAAELLHGLGFSRVMMERKTKDMSGEGRWCLCFCLHSVCGFRSHDGAQEP
jgi:ATPase subunit of ABC transporter with duplicated ATPase domains